MDPHISTTQQQERGRRRKTWASSRGAADVDDVSCSPFCVPVARLEAGRAMLLASPTDSR